MTDHPPLPRSDELAAIIAELEQDGDALPAMLARLRDMHDRELAIEHSHRRCPPTWRGAYPWVEGVRA